MVLQPWDPIFISHTERCSKLVQLYLTLLQRWMLTKKGLLTFPEIYIFGQQSYIDDFSDRKYEFQRQRQTIT